MRNKNIKKYNVLTPTNNAYLGEYEEALDFVFKSEEIRNIAITGAYGAGKSSVINSYKEKKKSRFITISLAGFSYSNNQKEPVNRGRKIEDNQINIIIKDSGRINSSYAHLEGKILNQLIHQISYKNIPLTKFKIKAEVPFWKAPLIWALITILLVSTGALLNIENSEKYFNSFGLYEWKGIKMYNVVSLISFIIASMVVLFILIRHFLLRGIKGRIKIQGNEIEIHEDTEESYFDRYLDEVLYLFEHCGASAIIIEDLDRLNSPEIFTKLREINELVNIRIKNKNNKNKIIKMIKKIIKKNNSKPLRWKGNTFRYSFYKDSF